MSDWFHKFYFKVMRRVDFRDSVGRKKSWGMDERPTMHCQVELEQDIQGHSLLDSMLIQKWFDDRYSASKHLLALYSMVTGLNAKTILEVGFGRSTFALAAAAYKNQGKMYSLDTRDFSYLLSDAEREVVDFIQGFSSKAWEHPHLNQEGLDFAFLDYFSNDNMTQDECYSEISSCYSLLKQNAILCIHDVIEKEYVVGSVMENFANENNAQVLYLPYNSGLGIIRRCESSPFGVIEDFWEKK